MERPVKNPVLTGLPPGVVIVSYRIDRANQIRGRIHILNSIETNPGKAVGRPIRFAGTDPEPAIYRIQIERAYSQRLCGVEDRSPGRAAIKRAINAALRRADINLVWISRIDLDRRYATTNIHPGGRSLTQRNRIRSQLKPTLACRPLRPRRRRDRRL